MSEKRRLLHTLLLQLMLFAAVLLAVPGAADAGRKWRARKFAKMLSKAENAYNVGDYTLALERYVEVDEYLSLALREEAVPEEQANDARLALLAIRYQRARSTQLLDDCAGANEIYAALLTSLVAGNKNPALATKTKVRLAETTLCVVRSSPDSVDESVMLASVVQSEGLLAKAIEEMDETLSDEERSVLRIELGVVQKELAEIRKGMYSPFAAAANEALEANDCATAKEQYAHAVKAAGEAHAAALEETRVRVDGCFTQTAPEVVEEGPSVWDDVVPVLPWVLVGVGGVCLASAVVVEVTSFGVVEKYEDAQNGCDRDDAFACADQVELATGLENRRTATGLLVGFGAAALTAGLVWHSMQDDDTESTGDETALWLGPLPGGAAAGLRSRF